ncbi:MAG: hypothetical protein LBS10_05950 [Gracilibacteraceae bacterium]|nr:hypothetical protein [Gracilibacteraceae bacterium]
MKKRAKRVCTALCALSLALSLAACASGTSQAPSTPAADGAAESLTIGGYPAMKIGNAAFYVEVFTPESDPGENPSAIESAKILGIALDQTEVGVLPDNHNLFIALTGIDSPRGADAYAFAVSSGLEFDPQNYAGLYCAVDYDGNVFFMPNGNDGEWELLTSESEGGGGPLGQTDLEIETGVFYAEGVTLPGDPGDNPSAFESAKTAWETMKEHGAPAGTLSRDIILMLTGIETINAEDFYIYSVQLDYGYGPADLFRVAVNYRGDVLCDADDGKGWESLPYGDMFGGEKAYPPED